MRKKSLLSSYVSITDTFEGFRVKLLPEASQLLSLAQQSNSVFGRLVVEVFRSHTITHSLGLLCACDRPVAEAATYTTNTRHELPYPERDSKPAIPAVKRLQTHASDRTSTSLNLHTHITSIK